MEDKEPDESPRVMIVLLSATWMNAPRLPKALTAVGFKVASFCPAGSFLTKTRYAERVFESPESGPVFPQFVDAVRQYRPDMIIPGCDLSVRFLHNIIRAADDVRHLDGVSDVVAVVGRSLGDTAFHETTLSKHETQAVARQLGLTTPRQALVNDAAEATLFAKEIGYPIVLKGEFGWAGNLVRICGTPEDTLESYREMRSQSPNERIAAQQYIAGTPAMQVATAISGRVLERVTLLKTRTHPHAKGPSSVLTLIEDEAAGDALTALMNQFGFNGFGHADFILESTTGLPYLLEFNPRISAACPLGHLFGRNLCDALYRRLSGMDYQRSNSRADVKTVALFPNEWRRDPNSEYLTGAYHDAPWDDPLLLKAIIEAHVHG